MIIRTILDYLKKYFYLTIGLLISAINFNLLLKPINLVAGGTTGLSLIVQEVFLFDIDYFITIVYIITFVISLIFLGKKSFLGLLYASVMYPVFVTLTSDISKIIIMNYNDLFLVSIFAGILSGISSGLIYKNGFPSSGIGVIAPILNKYLHFSISTTNLIINTVIVVIGGYYFGINMILYAIILLYINSVLCNKIILGVSSNKAVFINSNKSNEIIVNLTKLKIKTTIINSKGGYTNDDNNIIMAIIPSYKYNYLKSVLRNIDKNVFFHVSDAYEIKNN